ncbi:hypothetical protein [Micromonospora sp. NPDC051296]|uniref:hypothetical protein n=1 Tax=Micromonospora sp. NPDC051296 TaxID=3155046 RepID=UPI003429A266
MAIAHPGGQVSSLVDQVAVTLLGLAPRVAVPTWLDARPGSGWEVHWWRPHSGQSAYHLDRRRVFSRVNGNWRGTASD